MFPTPSGAWYLQALNKCWMNKWKTTRPPQIPPRSHFLPNLWRTHLGSWLLSLSALCFFSTCFPLPNLLCKDRDHIFQELLVSAQILVDFKWLILDSLNSILLMSGLAWISSLKNEVKFIGHKVHADRATSCDWAGGSPSTGAWLRGTGGLNAVCAPLSKPWVTGVHLPTGCHAFFSFSQRCPLFAEICVLGFYPPRCLFLIHPKILQKQQRPCLLMIK